jgi:hypothetical protein
MDITTFLAQIWGPIVLAVGLGMFVSRAHYARIYRNLENEALAILVFAMAGIAAGVLQVTSHSLWGTPAQILISFLGWALLVKSVMLAIMPSAADRLGDWAANARLITLIGGVMILAGGYLSWVGFFA